MNWIDEANNQLKQSGCPLKLEKRGQYVSIRGTMSFGDLPAKQTRVATKMLAVKENLHLLVQKAKETWRNCTNNPIYTVTSRPEASHPETKYDVDSEVLYSLLKTHVLSESKISTWNKAYKPYVLKICRQLKKGGSLEKACKSVAYSYSTDRRSRMVCLTCIRRIYEIISEDIPDSIDLIPCSYSPSLVSFEPLPSDDEIFLQYSALQAKSSQWANVYALMATYGLRNHEVFRCKLVQQKTLVCLVDEDSKTGSRVAFPYFPDAINRFNLTESIELPKLNSKDIQRISSQVSLQFNRYGVPFPAMHLRRSYACRCIELNNDFIVAKSLGHSVQILNQTYRKHIDPARLASFSTNVFDIAS